jgi:hypothetical protein
MEGNNKADASWKVRDGMGSGGVQRDFFSNSGQLQPVLAFYDISGTRMHLTYLKKSWVWHAADIAIMKLV